MEERPLLDEDAEAAWELLVFGSEPRPAARDHPESAAWLRAQLQELGFTQGSFARFMLRRGDVRSERNVLRSIQRMCAGQVRVPGEMRVLLGVMLRSKRRGEARRARARDERDAPWNDPCTAPHAGPENLATGQARCLDAAPQHDHPSEALGADGPGGATAGRKGSGSAGGGEAQPDHLSEQRGERGPRCATAGRTHGRAMGWGEAPPGDSSERRGEGGPAVVEQAEREASSGGEAPAEDLSECRSEGR